MCQVFNIFLNSCVMRTYFSVDKVYMTHQAVDVTTNQQHPPLHFCSDNCKSGRTVYWMLLLLLQLTVAPAMLRVPSFIADNMILQRKGASVWGWVSQHMLFQFYFADGPVTHDLCDKVASLLPRSTCSPWRVHAYMMK
jgi:hypothetical protein